MISPSTQNGTNLLANSNIETGYLRTGPRVTVVPVRLMTWGTSTYHSASHSLKTVMSTPGSWASLVSKAHLPLMLRSHGHFTAWMDPTTHRKPNTNSSANAIHDLRCHHKWRKGHHRTLAWVGRQTSIQAGPVTPASHPRHGGVQNVGLWTSLKEIA